MAYTKAVPKKGNITQNHSGKRIRNKTVPINETPVIIQYFFLELASELMYLEFAAKVNK